MFDHFALGFGERLAVNSEFGSFKRDAHLRGQLSNPDGVTGGSVDAADRSFAILLGYPMDNSLKVPCIKKFRFWKTRPEPLPHQNNQVRSQIMISTFQPVVNGDFPGKPTVRPNSQFGVVQKTMDRRARKNCVIGCMSVGEQVVC